MVHTTVDCPNCAAERTGATVRSIVQAAKDIVGVAATCNVCGTMFALQYHTTGVGNLTPGKESIGNVSVATGLNPSWVMLSSLPERPAERIVQHLPEHVEESFREAEMNFSDRRLASASMMYRRAVELTLKKLYPQITGTLWKRIQSIREQNVIPSGLTETLDGARILGNEATHEMEPLSAQDVEALRSFTTLLLVFLLELPEEVRRAKERRKQAEGG